MSNCPSELLIALSRNRWNIPVLAAFKGEDSARFAVLLNRLPISRESLARTLACAVEAGWLVRNRGYGHPLRPEYRMTEKGKTVASMCMAIDGARARLNIAATEITRWSLPIVHVVREGAERFGDIERALPASNPRALSQSLRTLVGQDLMTRRVIDNYPPVALYGLSDRGTRLASALLA
jgi:DNA-binding HxlR family transcriptional regulator